MRCGRVIMMSETEKEILLKAIPMMEEIVEELDSDFDNISSLLYGALKGTFAPRVEDSCGDDWNIIIIPDEKEN